MTRSVTAVVLTALMGTGCAWVMLTPEGEKTRVLSESDVRQCDKVGRTTTATKAEIVSIDRADTKVADELEILARNSAAQMGGDTVVPSSPVQAGQQTFQVYKCVP